MKTTTNGICSSSWCPIAGKTRKNFFNTGMMKVNQILKVIHRRLTIFASFPNANPKKLISTKDIMQYVQIVSVNHRLLGCGLLLFLLLLLLLVNALSSSSSS